jgi:hypothetical protein
MRSSVDIQFSVCLIRIILEPSFPSKGSQARGTRLTTTLPYLSPSDQAPIPSATQNTTLPYQSPSSQAPIPPGTQTTTFSYQTPSYQDPIPPGTHTTTLPYPISPQMQGDNSAINLHLKVTEHL